MKVKWTGDTSFLVLTKNRIYEVLSVVRDDSGEDYLYPPEQFEIVEE